MKTLTTTLTLFAVLIFSTAAISGMHKKDIVDTAIGAGSFSTLVAAVQAADLENALVNAGPLMVFAPVNAAFDALPEGTVETLLKPENKNDLANKTIYEYSELCR